MGVANAPTFWRSFKEKKWKKKKGKQSATRRTLAFCTRRFLWLTFWYVHFIEARGLAGRGGGPKGCDSAPGGRRGTWPTCRFWKSANCNCVSVCVFFFRNKMRNERRMQFVCQPVTPTALTQCGAHRRDRGVAVYTHSGAGRKSQTNPELKAQ